MFWLFVSLSSFQLFFGSLNSNSDDFDGADDRHLHLSSYLEALTCVLRCAPCLTPASAAAVQRLLAHAVSTFPRLPEQYRRFSLIAVRDAFSAAERLTPGMTGELVYQGVVQSCSYPVVTKTEEEVLETAATESMVSVDSFFPLWHGLVNICSGNQQEVLCAAFVESCLAVLEKLDFTFKQEKDEREEDELEVSKVKDFTIMANLVRLFDSVASKFPSSMFCEWAESFALRVVRLSTRFPHVSGCYSLFSTFLEAARGTDYFASRCQPPALRTLSSFVRDTLQRSSEYDGELLLSCLAMCIKAPTALADAAGLSAYSEPLERLFRRLAGRNLGLVEAAVRFLEAVKENVDGELINALLEQLMPSIKAFLHVDQTDGGFDEVGDLEHANTKRATTRRSRRKKGRNLTSPAEISDFERIRKRLLLFLGRLEMGVLVSLAPSKQERGKRLTALDPERSLWFDVPFQDGKARISLDDLMPRVLKLCIECSVRKTRVAACEALHAIVLLLIGRYVLSGMLCLCESV